MSVRPFTLVLVLSLIVASQFTQNDLRTRLESLPRDYEVLVVRLHTGDTLSFADQKRVVHLHHKCVDNGEPIGIGPDGGGTAAEVQGVRRKRRP